jgi:hypothetical protein
MVPRMDCDGSPHGLRWFRHGLRRSRHGTFRPFLATGPSALYIFPMIIQDLREMQQRAPFRPFNLHLRSGDVLPVLHPENLSTQPGVEIFTLWLGGRRWNLVDITAIDRFSLIEDSGLKIP